MTFSQIIKKTKNTLLKHGLMGVFSKVWMYIHRFFRILTFSPYSIQRTVQGEPITFYIADVIGEEWYTNLKEDVPEIRWLKEHISKGDYVVDCGAHHGLMAVLFGKWVGPAGSVTTFEALPTNADVVKKNISLNNLQCVTVRNEAVGKEVGTISFTLDSNASVATSADKKTIQVPVVNLDSALNNKPDLLKIDVEGFEMEVVKGASEILKSKPALAIEIHCIMYRDPVAEVTELLSLLNLGEYTTWIQSGYYDALIPYDPQIHTPAYFVQYDKVNLYAVPKS
jgi:FkbM family methyltransferase